MTKKITQTSKSIGLKHGFRSGLEDAVAAILTAKRVGFEYEKFTITFTKPASKHKYTPDFKLLHNGIIVETKGRFITADRQKHLLIKEQFPEHDIRFVFSNSRTKISKRSPTTYGMWCEKNGFKYADKVIPESWLTEKGNTNV
jgi:hypothetical protein